MEKCVFSTRNLVSGALPFTLELSPATATRPGMKRALLLPLLALCGCISTAERNAKVVAQSLHPGMTQSDVIRLFGQPTKTETKSPGVELERAWGGPQLIRRDTQELEWEYDRSDLVVTFAWSGSQWAVKGWKF
jgi:hypothetical protein